MRVRFIVLVLVALSALACGNDVGPSSVGTMTFTQVTPPSGSTIIVSSGAAPGAFIERNSGQLSVGLRIRSAREVDWAKLDVYLLTMGSTGDSRCGQNSPDAPTWGPFRAGRTESVTITGFQIFRLPCAVTGIRAILHLRQGGLNTTPMASEILADGTMAVSYSLQR